MVPHTWPTGSKTWTGKSTDIVQLERSCWSVVTDTEVRTRGWAFPQVLTSWWWAPPGTDLAKMRLTGPLRISAVKINFNYAAEIPLQLFVGASFG